MLADNEVTHLIVDLDKVTDMPIGVARRAACEMWIAKWGERIRGHLLAPPESDDDKALKEAVAEIEDLKSSIRAAVSGLEEAL